MKLPTGHYTAHIQHNSQTGLGEAHKRSLIYIVFLCTAIALPIFAVTQFLNGHLYVAAGTLLISAISLFSAYRVSTTRNIVPWIVGFLVPAFCFFIYIIAKPEATPTTFIWICIIPIMAYLLLGRVMGFVLSVPFMVCAGVYMVIQIAPLDGAHDWFNLLNPILCGVAVLCFVHLYESMRAADQAKLLTMARTDALTGLANRNNFESTLKRTIEESKRSNLRFALVLMDIDLFKDVNDTYGHDAGDEALKFMCRRLTGRLRGTDFIARQGGEEFGIILRDVDRADAYRLTEELRMQITESNMVYEGKPINLTATFGIGHWPQDAHEAGQLYRVADRRLYAGKTTGRNITVSEDKPSVDASPPVPDDKTAYKGTTPSLQSRFQKRLNKGSLQHTGIK